MVLRLTFVKHHLSLKKATLPVSVSQKSHSLFILDKASGLSITLVSTEDNELYEEKYLQHSLGLCRPYNQLFIIADVNNSILGAAFLHKFCLGID